MGRGGGTGGGTGGTGGARRLTNDINNICLKNVQYIRSRAGSG